MSNASQETDEIRRHMAQIRRELHEDMQNVVLGAEAVADWQRYIRLYPWVSVGLAFAAGYLIIPRRRPSRTEIAEDAAEDAAERTRTVRKARRGGVEIEEREEVADRKKKKAGLIGALFGMATPVLMRVAQNYASNYLENMLVQHNMFVQEPTTDPGNAAGPGPGPGPMK